MITFHFQAIVYCKIWFKISASVIPGSRLTFDVHNICSYKQSSTKKKGFELVRNDVNFEKGQ